MYMFAFRRQRFPQYFNIFSELTVLHSFPCRHKYKMFSMQGFLVCLPLSIEEGAMQKKRQRLSLLFGGQNLFNSLPL